jgi:hypothetical protein
MNHDEIKNLAKAAAKKIKTEADLNEFRQMLIKITVETALNAELDDHLGYSKHEESDSSNSRNGSTRKTLQPVTANFRWTRRETEKAASNPNWRKNISAATPPWTIGFSFSMRMV